jgi:signal transduction histidine kinase
MFEGVGTRTDTYSAVELCTKMLVCMLEHAAQRHTAELAAADAERIARDKVEFLARLSHELRNPLNAVSGYLELLRLDLSTRLTDVQSGLLDHVQASARILANLIDDVMTFAKLEVSHITYDIQSIRIGDIIDSTALIIKPFAESQGFSLQICVPDRDLLIQADCTRVRQILTNLLTNAVKFTARGGVIQLSCNAMDADTVQFIVSDSGAGIPGNKLEAIFHPYVQAGRPVIGNVGGSGLGLAIGRELAEGMNGRLFAKSVIGRGSTFTLELPRAKQLTLTSQRGTTLAPQASLG